MRLTITAANLPQAQEVHKPEHARLVLHFLLHFSESGAIEFYGKGA